MTRTDPADLADLVAAVPDLPAGRLVAPVHDPSSGPVLWVSDAPAVAGQWARLAAAHSSTGCWPVLLEGLDGDDVERPWRVGEFAPVRNWAPGDTEAFLAEAYAEAFGDEDPDPAWPGSSPALTPVADPALAAAQFAGELLVHGPRHLGLVHVERGADVPGALGWFGAVNHDTDPADLSGVLRSWEDRFGVRLVGMGFDTVQVSVAAPPSTPAQALAVAVEHLGFCCDAVVQDGPGDVRAYAEDLVGAWAWRFRWD
ncbi:DUF4253 domain-containing protein [Kineococcus sp. SYSU DK003]|uniref:DUF4253 domain-containing protein n=1 Tax=Kineococcus sp. SYSU DK003 TaxID=3383124 RepID=UPI003D7C888F